MTQTFIISNGEYSDYGVAGIVQGDTNPRALYPEFKEWLNSHIPSEKERLTDSNYWYAYNETIKTIIELLPSLAGEKYIHADDIFLAWLVERRSFLRVEYEEFNLGEPGDDPATDAPATTAAA